MAGGATLSFDAATIEPGIELRARPRRLYRSDRACSFPLTIETPRPIAKPRLRWQVKLATGADVLIDEERELDAIAGSGPLAVVPALAAADMARRARARSTCSACTSCGRRFPAGRWG